MDYIAEIKALAEEGKRLDPKYNIFGACSHKWQFGEPVNMQQIRSFENDMKIKLPEPFVRYLTELGNGGAGPDYGIYTLDMMRKRNPFIRETANFPVMLDHSLTATQWADFAKKYETIDAAISCDISDTSEEQERAVQELHTMELHLLAGGIFISTPGCTMNSILMCRGAAAGEVFTVDFDYMFQLQSEPYCNGKFEDWVIRAMQRALR